MNNSVFHNNFINNWLEPYGDSNTTWDDGYPSGGNYWSNYKGVDENGDGIGDIPYNISGGNAQDRYPLLFPYSSTSIVEITTPLEGYIYFGKFRNFPFFTTVIMGSFQINVTSINYVYGIDRVEFYIDGDLKNTDTTAPYTWTWRFSSHLKHRHILKVIAFDKNGASISDELTIWKFL
jgi:hypothetical protein